MLPVHTDMLLLHFNKHVVHCINLATLVDNSYFSYNGFPVSFLARQYAAANII